MEFRHLLHPITMYIPRMGFPSTQETTQLIADEGMLCLFL